MGKLPVSKTRWVYPTTGDNLDILRGFNDEMVDLVYLDPPFNSNRTYAAPIGSKAAGAAFKDTWTLSDVDVAEHGLLADEHPAIYRVIDAAKATHGASMMSYLIMMASRLVEMRRCSKRRVRSIQGALRVLSPLSPDPVQCDQSRLLGQHLDRWGMSTRPKFHVPKTILTLSQVQFILRKRQPLGSDFVT